MKVLRFIHQYGPVRSFQLWYSESEGCIHVPISKRSEVQENLDTKLRRNGFKVTDYSKLCAKHFTPDQFTTLPALAKKCGYKKLDHRPDAIPTLFDLPIEKVEKKTEDIYSLLKAKDDRGN